MLAVPACIVIVALCPATAAHASSVGPASAELTSTAGGATSVTYTVSFTASGSGRLEAGSGTITVSTATGTALPSAGCSYTVADTTANSATTPTSCPSVSLSNAGATAQLTLPAGFSIAAGDAVTVSIAGVTNPPAGPDTISVSTSADTTPVSAPVITIVAPQSVENASASLSSLVGQETDVTYTVGFDTSSSGGLVGGAGTVTIAAASGTAFPDVACDYAVSDKTSGHSDTCVDSLAVGQDGNTVTFALPAQVSTASGDNLNVVVSGVTNPAATTEEISVSTSSDTVVASTEPVVLSGTPGITSSVTGVSLATSTSAESATGVTYTVTFQASADGGFPAGGGVTLVAPVGTVFDAGNECIVVQDLTTDQSSGCDSASFAGDGSIMTVYSQVAIGPSDSVQVTETDVSNPGLPATYVSVSTVADGVFATSPTVDLTAPASVAGASLSAAPHVSGAAEVTDTVTFTASATGALEPGSGTITLEGSPGTDFALGNCTESVTDETTGASACANALAGGASSASTVTITVPSNVTIGAGDAVEVQAFGATNPSSLSLAVDVSTSSDLVAAPTSAALSTAKAVTPDAPSLELSTTAAGASGVTETVTFTASSLGELASGWGTITLAGTAGTAYPGNRCDYDVDDLTTQFSNPCAASISLASSGPSPTVTLTVPLAIRGSDEVRVTISGVLNPGTGADSVSLSTSTDTDAVSTSSVSLVDAGGVSDASASVSPPVRSAAGAEMSVTFTTSSTGALAGGASTITLRGAPGTVFPSPSCGGGSYNVYDVTRAAGSGCITATQSSAGGSVVDLDLPSGFYVDGGDTVTVTVLGVSNPPSASQAVTVSTSSDLIPVTTASTALVASSSVTGLGLTVTPAVARASATDVVTFDSTSAIGNAGYPNDGSVTLDAPPGTSLPSNGCDYTLTDVTTSTSDGCLSINLSGDGSTVGIPLPAIAIASGDEVEIQITGTVNPITTSMTFSVATNADLVPQSTPEVSLASAKPPASVSLALSSTAAGATGVTYTMSFAASNQGAFPAGASLEFVATPGTVFPGNGCDITISDETTGHSASCVNEATAFNQGSAMGIDAPFQVNAGDEVQVVVQDVSNSEATSESVQILTASDPSFGSSAAVSLSGGTAPSSVGSPTLTLGDDVTSAVNTSATVSWTASAAAPPGEVITVEATHGAVFTDGDTCGYVLTDETTGDSSPLCSNGFSAWLDGIGSVSAYQVLLVYANFSIGAGDHLSLSIQDVDTGSSTASVEIATTAEQSFVSTAPVSLSAPQSVSSPTLSITGAVAGRTNATWTVTLTASSTGALQGGQQVTLEAPPGTYFPGDTNCDITFEDVTTDFSNSGCFAVYPTWSGEEVSLFEPGNFPVHAGDEIEITIPGVQNPPSSSASVEVWTSSDSVPATSNSVSLAAAGSVSAVSASLSSAADGASFVTGTFGFTASASGAFEPGDEITISGSAGVSFPGSGCDYTVTDTTTGHSDNCVNVLQIAADGSTVSLAPGVGISAGDSVVVTVTGMQNPLAGQDGSGAGTASFALSTTPDGAPVAAAAIALAASSHVDDLNVTLSDETEGAAGVGVSASFEASAANGTLASDSEITLSGATGTLWPANACDYTVTDTTTGHSSGCMSGVSILDDGAVATITTQNGFTVSPGDSVTIEVTGETNASSSSDAISVSTSSDTLSSSTVVALNAPAGVSTPSVSLSSDAASATDVTETVTFDTSATGQMADGSAVITLQASPGTRFPDSGCSFSVTDETNTHSSGCVQSYGIYDAGSEALLVVPSGFSIGAGDTLSVTVTGVSNTGASSPDSVTVETSSDPLAVASAAATIVAPSAPSSASLSTSSGSVGEPGVTYSVGFTASATGALEAGSGTITVLAQAGTGFADSGSWCAVVYDLTTDRQSSCQQQAVVADSGAAITVTTPIAVGAGDGVLLTLTDTTNPPVAATQPLEVWTSSDTVPATVAEPELSGDAITGTVEAPVSGAVTGLAGVAVEACPASGACVSGGTTGSGGGFSIAVPAGTYYVEASPPPGGGVGSSSAYQAAEYGPVVLANGASATGIVITLGAESAVPSGATVNGSSGVVPTIYWASAQTITVTGCPDGIADVVLQGTDEESGATILRTVPLTETPAGSGTYTGTVPPLQPVHGNVTVGASVYCAPLTGVVPYAGPTDGGTTVTIYGTGFDGATAVHFGSAAATGVQVVSDTEVTAIAPAGTGTVPVTVTTPSGTTAESSLAQYTYLSVASVSPDIGNTAGDGTVLVTGTGFTSAEQVYFGTTRTLFSVLSDTELIAWVPPASAAGVVDVTVETSGGTSTTSSADDFTYSASAPTPSTPQRIPNPPSTGTPTACPSSGLSICSAPPTTRATNAPPLTGGYGGTMPDPAGWISAISSGATYSMTSGDTPPDGSGDWTSFLQWNGNTDWIGDVASIGDNLSSIMDGDVFASDIAEEEDFDGGFGSLSDTLAELLGDSALEDSFLDFALGPVGGIALAAFQMYCSSTQPGGILGGACAVASVPTDLLGLALSGATSLLQKLWNEYIDPSGTVVDDKGNPISGATVTILSSSSGTAAGPYVAVPAGSVEIQPTTNPELSSDTGQFAWDALPGWYEIEASKSGCHAPGAPGDPDATTAPFQLPPPADGLQIVLTCESEPTPPAPAVTGLSIASGPAAGGTTLSISGSGFLSSSTVAFGSKAATSVLVVSPTDIEATAPSGSGTVDVTVSNSAGTSSTGTPDEFTYVSAPTVTSLSSHDGTLAGGSVIELDGTGFDDATGVQFGSIPAINFVVLSNTQLRATSPPGTGTVDVTVTDLDGASATSSADRFTYVSPLGVSTSSLPDATVGLAYSATLRASGGVSPYSWKLVSGSLPAGLSISSSGVISGVPTATGSKTFGVRVSDSDTPKESVTTELSLEVMPNTGPGYWLATSKGTVYGFGSALPHGSKSKPSGAVVGIAAAAPSKPGGVSTGYWMATSTGTVYGFGSARVLGHPSKPSAAVTAIAAAPKGLGYFLVTAAGVVYAYGSAKAYGGEKKAPSSPIVGIAPDPKGTGYWLVAKDGTVYGFGSAAAHGSVKHASGTVVGIVSDAKGTGYWVATSKGAVYHFGSAKAYGGEKKAPSSPIVGIALDPKGTGYWLAGARGAVYPFGSATSLGAPKRPSGSVVGIAGT